MMDNIKIGLLGLITVISGYSVYQVSTVKAEMETLKEEMSAKMTMLKVSSSSTSPAATPNQNTPPNNTNNLPSTEIKSQGPTTSIKFDEEIHDFGTVEVESENLYAFTFTNTGSEPLTISNAKGSCGCTVPQWPKEPILPGQSGKIDIKFTPNAGQAGKPQEKVVTITANTSPVNTMVRIKADVIAK